MKVLVAEDEVDIQFLYRAWLTREGYEVTVVADGEEALAATAKETFDCVILDVMMPRVDGLEVCRRLRTGAGSDVPIILVSALARPADIAAGLEAGADAYVDKPITPRIVVEKIRQVTGAA